MNLELSRIARRRIVRLSVTLVGIVCLYVIVFRLFTGPIRPPLTDVGDYNPELTKLAHTAVPIINAIQVFHSEKRNFPSDHELREALRDPRLAKYSDNELGNSVMTSGGKTTWSYNYLNEGAGGFRLTNSVEPIETLFYKYGDGNGQWFYTCENQLGVDQPVKLKP